MIFLFYRYQNSKISRSFICRRELGFLQNMNISFLLSSQGLPVFRDPLAPPQIGLKSCHFGNKCFQRVTKVKSRLVLQILKMGYNVLLSDADVYWFQNPLPFLQSLALLFFLAQSDEFNETGKINFSQRYY